MSPAADAPPPDGGDGPWHSYHTAYTNARAGIGMEGVDEEKVQKVIYEMSKGSKYFENEQRKEALNKRKIEHLRAQCASLTDNDIHQFQKIAENKMLELEASRDLSKIWLHADMDAFYAAIETLDNPSLKGKPLAVGTMSMIVAASYEARKFGVRAGMPGFKGCKLCPGLVFVPANFEKYNHYSELTRKVFHRYDPNLITTSLDEVYLNITNICSERDVTGEEVATELRAAIHQETGLTCSVGVAPNRMIAKIGGIGKVKEQMFHQVLEIRTCQDMLRKAAFLCALFSESSADFFLSIGLGLGGTESPELRQRKSISCERTFTATNSSSFLLEMLANLAEKLADNLQKEGLKGRTLTLKLKTADFEVRMRAATSRNYINSSKEDILIYATKLINAELPLSLRLMGLRMAQLYDGNDSSSTSTQKTLDTFLRSSNNKSNSDGINVHDSSFSLTRDEGLEHDAGTDGSMDQEAFLSHDESLFTPEQRSSVNCSSKDFLGNRLIGEAVRANHAFHAGYSC